MDKELYAALSALKERMDARWMSEDRLMNAAALTWDDIRELWPPVDKAIYEYKAILDARASAWP